MKINKGDNVKILSGKEKGKTAVVEKSFPREGLIVVKGVNVVKRHTKAQGKGKPGGIIIKEMPIAASRVLLICPSCNKPSRMGFKIVSGKKYRRCTRCNEVIK